MQLFVAILKDFRSENIEFSKYQLIIDRGRDFVEAVYFLAKKKTASPFAFQQPPRAGVFSRSLTSVSEKRERSLLGDCISCVDHFFVVVFILRFHSCTLRRQH